MGQKTSGDEQEMNTTPLSVGPEVKAFQPSEYAYSSL
jgi:hypothetical protein